MSNRIEKAFDALKAENKKAFITYVTAGLPTMEATKEIIKAQVGYTDVIELGIPFSDPIADGPVIQQASYEAIQGGANITGAFRLMKELRSEGVNIPIVFMLYYNTVFNMGEEQFINKCRECGVDGLIIPDLPYEEQDGIRAAIGDDDTTILIQLIAPTSGERIPALLDGARGFVYCVSAMGVTGQEGTFHKSVEEYLRSVKSRSTIPVMMGFGIRTAEDVRPFKDIIDGAIVGTHFINLLREGDFKPDVATAYVKEFKEADQFFIDRNVQFLYETVMERI